MTTICDTIVPLEVQIECRQAGMVLAGTGLFLNSSSFELLRLIGRAPYMQRMCGMQMGMHIAGLHAYLCTLRRSNGTPLDC